MALIHDREATIKTAVVEIRALSVSGKQVTLALFRQIQDEALIDAATLQLRGVPWGFVNYHWGACENEGEHLHIVWQWGEELRRSLVCRNQGARLRERYAQSAQLDYGSEFLNMAQQSCPEVRKEDSERRGDFRSLGKLDPYGVCDHDHSYYSARIGERNWDLLPGSVLDRLRRYWRSFEGEGASDFQEANEHRAQHFQAAADRAVKRGKARREWAEKSAAQWRDCAENRLAQGAEAEQRWERLYESLRDLDHLFIAL